MSYEGGKSLIAAIVFIMLFIMVEIWVHYTYKTFMVPATIYNVMWCLMPACASLSIGGLIVPSLQTVLVIITSVIIFNITTFIYTMSVKGHTRKSYKENSLLNWNCYRYNRKIFCFLNLLAIGYSMLFIEKSLTYLLRGGFVQLRYQYLNTSTLGNIMTTKQALLFQWICIPIFIVNVLIFAISIMGKKRDKIVTIFALLGVVIRILITGGRMAAFELVSAIALAYVLYPSKRRIKFSAMQKLVIVLLVVVLIYITSIRRIGDSTIFENIIVYLAGPISYLDNIVLNPEMFGIGVEKLYGQATFGFITNIVLIAAWFVLGIEYRGSEAIVSEYTKHYFYITETEKGNHMYTMLYPFLMDFGYVGVIIGMIFVAVLAAAVFLKANRNNLNPTRWLLYSLYISYALFFSLFEYRFVYPATFFIFLFIYVITFNSNKVGEV